MRRMSYAEAVDDALAQAMADDPRIVVMGEDVRSLRADLLVRFGTQRVRNTPISESAFLGAGVAAAMGGLHPVIEIMLVDFIGVAMDALLNQAAKIEAFSGGKWRVPLLVRTAVGGGYGDGGQHEQSLWGWLAHIPGLAVVLPSTPADAGGLMLAAVKHEGPIIFMEHKLLSEKWLSLLGSGGRKTVQYDIPKAGAYGLVPNRWEPIPIGKAVVKKEGSDLTMISLGVGVHRCLEAVEVLEAQGISAGMIDLRSVSPLDKQMVCQEAAKTGRVIVVDEDYQGYGLSGELAAIILEAGIPIKFQRVCTETTIPYARDLEDQTLPNTHRILAAAHRLLEN